MSRPLLVKRVKMSLLVKSVKMSVSHVTAHQSGLIRGEL